MSECVDIHESVADICQRLGLDYKNVERLDIEPTTVTAVVLKNNDEGAKFIDEATGQAAVERMQFVVRT